MKRNLKALGLMALAAFALTAMFASAAQGQAGTLTAGETPETHKKSTIVGEQYGTVGGEWNFFQSTAGGEEVTCDAAKFTDTTVSGTETVLTSVAADYIHCQAGSSNRAATVNMNGCEYTFTRPETTAGGNGEYTGKADLTCPEGKRIKVDVYAFGNSTQTSHFFKACTIEVWPKEPTKANGHETQELGGHVIYKNIAEGKDDITAKVTASGITSFDGCKTIETHTNGVYKQTVTIKAFDDIDDSPNPTQHTEQYDLWISD